MMKSLAWVGREVISWAKTKSDSLPPIWHTFVPDGKSAEMRAVGSRESVIDIVCADCGRWPTHHFHTGIVGAECGCDDCRPVNPVYADDEHMTADGRISVPRRSPFRRVGRYFRKSRPR